MRTALHLRSYEDLLDPLEVYSFLALAAFYNQFFMQCSKVRPCHENERGGAGGMAGKAAGQRPPGSRLGLLGPCPPYPLLTPPFPTLPPQPPPPKAFIKLESLPSIPSDKREAFSDLAMAIFLKHPPADPRALRETREKKGGPGAGGGAGAAAVGGLDALLDDLGGGREQVGGKAGGGRHGTTQAAACRQPAGWSWVPIGKSAGATSLHRSPFPPTYLPSPCVRCAWPRAASCATATWSAAAPASTCPSATSCTASPCARCATAACSCRAWAAGAAAEGPSWAGSAPRAWAEGPCTRATDTRTRWLAGFQPPQLPGPP
jgi:hypothetical protein